MDRQNFQVIQAGTTVVTANQRLFRALTGQFEQHCLAAGQCAWETPNILPWGAWLESLWDEVAFSGSNSAAPQLLSDFEAQLVWEHIIAGSEVADGLLQVSTTAKIARESWDLQHAWRISDAALSTSGQGDVRVFRQWAGAFRKRCDDQGWLDHGRLADQLAERIASGELPELLMPKAIWLAGFTEQSPQSQALCDALEGVGIKVSSYPTSDAAGIAERVVFADAAAEAGGVASWIASELTTDPDLRIAVVVPQLRAARAQVMRIFDDVLVPELALPGNDHERRPYNLSLGDPLSEQAMVDTALRLLRISTGALATDEVGALLRSPFLDGAELEFTQRACLDADLRRQRRHEVGLHALAKRLQQPQTRHGCLVLQQLVERIIELGKEQSSRKALSNWAEHFSAVLSAAGWPGRRPLSATEHQVMEQWQRVMDTFATLDRVSPMLSRRDAIGLLTRLSSRQIFQVRTPALPIQVLGPLEAIGQTFDRLWIMNLHDEVWPEQARPSPFLPVALQRDLGIPHASAARQLAYARQVLELLLRTAPRVFVSHASNEGDRQLRVSALVSGLPVVAADALNAIAATPLSEKIFAARSLEVFHDVQASEIATGSVVRGGVSLLRDQVACPFRAFARHRLRARALEQAASGLEPRERGELVHQALHFFWARLSRQSQLLNLDEQARSAMIDVAVARAIKEFEVRRPDLFGHTFTELEHSRVAALIDEWLRVDEGRPPFSISSVELRHEAEIADIRLRTQIDRIDRYQAGDAESTGPATGPDKSHVDALIIDYKTGNPNNTRISSWDGERPDDPQLPLYALTADADVGGVLFARVSKGKCGYVGLMRGGSTIPGVTALSAEQWREQLDSWRSALENLSSEYRRGDARVRPKSSRSCDVCDLHSFCRIHEQSTDAERP